MIYLPNHLESYHRYLEKTYPQSEILYNMGCLSELNAREQVNVYYAKAYHANPANYMSLYKGAVNCFYRGSDIYTITSLYNRIYKLLSRLELEEYTTQMDIRIRIARLEQLLHISTGYNDFTDIAIPSLTALKQELENSKLFENIFVALAYQNYRNSEIEEIAREKIKGLAKYQIEKHL